MESHDAKIKDIGLLADEIQATLRPKIEQQLRDAGYEVDDDGQSAWVITSAVFKHVDEFGESHELYDFWETHGDTLKSDGREMAEDEFATLQNTVAEYETLCNELRSDLIEERRSLQRQYNISSEEIESEEGDRFEAGLL